MTESRRDWTVEADLASERSTQPMPHLLSSHHSPCPPDAVLVKVNGSDGDVRSAVEALPKRENLRYYTILRHLPPDLCNDFFPSKQLPSEALPPRMLMGRSLLGKPVMHLPYEGSAFIEADDGSGNLPEYADISLISETKAAISIPFEWPLCIDPTHIITSDGSQVISPYAVDDVTRDTRLSELQKDISVFASRRLHRRVCSVVLFEECGQSDHEPAVTPWCDPSATAREVDLFNVAAGDRLRVYIVVDSLAAVPEDEPFCPIVPEQPVPPPPPFPPCACDRTPALPMPASPEAPPPMPPLPNIPTADALQRARALVRDGAGTLRPRAPAHNFLARRMIEANRADREDSVNLPNDPRTFRKLGEHLRAIELQPLQLRHVQLSNSQRHSGGASVRAARLSRVASLRAGHSSPRNAALPRSRPTRRDAAGLHVRRGD